MKSKSKKKKGKRSSLTSRGERNKARMLEALKRDVEQTKHDLTGGKKGEDLSQDVADTVKQATGRQPVPPAHVKSD